MAAEQRTVVQNLIDAIRSHNDSEFKHLLADTAPDDLDGHDERGVTPLLWAVREGWLEAVDRLLTAGADPNLGGSRIDYPLSASISLGHDDIADRLLRSPALNLAWQGFIAVGDALLGGDLAALDRLIEHGFDLLGPVPPQAGPRGAADCASALLFSTISCGQPRPEVFERLIALGANPDARSLGDSQAGLLCARANETPEVLRQLLKANVNVNAVDSAGYGPLHYAAARDHLESVLLLLEFGATPDLKAADGSFPLLWAASNGRGRVAALLRQATTSSVHDKALAELPAYWFWDGGTAWGALELAAGDGAWHGVAWASDEAKLMTELQRHYGSLRGRSPLCLVIHQLRSPVFSPSSPWRQPAEAGTLNVGQKIQLHHYAPLLAQGIVKPTRAAERHRFTITNEQVTTNQANLCLVDIRQIVSFYEGWTETYATAVCRKENTSWQLNPYPDSN